MLYVKPDGHVYLGSYSSYVILTLFTNNVDTFHLPAVI